MNIFIIGSGTFGTAISNELAQNINNNVSLFARSIDKVNEINNFNTNKKYFPNKQLNISLVATNTHSDIISADLILIAIPSSALKEVLLDFQNHITNKQLVVNLSKGIYENGNTIVDFLKEFLNSENIICLKGPSFAAEVMEHANTLLTLGYSTKIQKDIIRKIFMYTNIHLDYTKDIRGVEILSAIKNIYALLIGIIDAKYNSPNTRFMFLTKAFTEIRILNKVFKGDLDTLFLSCGLGDLCLTSLNDLSRNRTLGLLIGKGFYNQNFKENTVIIEGLNSINIIYELVDESVIKELPFLHRLNSFFNSNEKSFVLDFNDLLNE